MQRVSCNSACSHGAEPPEFGDEYPVSRKQGRPVNGYARGSLALEET